MWEREIMLERQREGIAKGKYKGRPASIDAAEIKRLNWHEGSGRPPSISALLTAPSIGC
jgi:hypothetical protein